jgi:hypothetical protein
MVPKYYPASTQPPPSHQKHKNLKNPLIRAIREIRVQIRRRLD